MAVKKNAKAVIEIEAKDNATKSLKNIGIASESVKKQIQLLEKTLKQNELAMKSAQIEVDKLANSYGFASSTSDSLNNSVSTLNGSINSFADTINNINQKMFFMIENIESITMAFDAMLSPDAINKLIQILNILSYYSDFKGLTRLSSIFDFLIVKIESLKKFLEMLHSKFGITFGTGNFESFNGAVDRLTTKADAFIKILNTLKHTLRIAFGFTIFGGAIKMLSGTEGGMKLLNSATSKLGEKLQFMSPMLSKLSDGISNYGSAAVMTGNVIKTEFNGNLLGSLEAMALLTPEIQAFLHSSSLLSNGVLGFASSIGTASIGVTNFALSLNALVMIGVSAFIDYMANTLVKVGDTMLEAMADFESRFKKIQSVMSQFNFVIGGLEKEFGKQATGGIELWKDKIGELEQTTGFSTASIGKSIKYLVAEGIRFGLSSDQISKLITRAGDVASGYGEDITDIATKMNSAFAGNALALTSMGFAVSDASNINAEYFLSLGKTSDQLSKTQTALTKYELIMKETSAVTGAASNELNTIAGATKAYERSINSVLARIGQMSQFSMMLIGLKKAVVDIFFSLPEPIISFIAVMWDALGITFKVVGSLLSVVTTVTMASTAYRILSTTIMMSVTVQTLLTKVFSVLGTAMGVQTVQVTTLGIAWSNLSLILRGVVVHGLASVKAALIAVSNYLVIAAGKALAFLGVILANPVTWIFVAIGSAILLVVEALTQMYDELDFIKENIDYLVKAFRSLFGTSKEASIFSGIITKISTGIQVFVDMIKLGIGLALAALQGLITGFYVLLDAVTFFQFPDIGDRTNKNIDVLSDLGDFTFRAALGFLQLDDNIAYAANSLDKAAKKAKEKEKILNKLIKAQMEGFDEATEKLKIFGDEFEKQALKQIQVTKELEKAKASTNDLEDKAKGIAEATKNITLAKLESEKLLFDTIKSISDEKENLEIESLKRSGKTVQAIEIENKKRLEAFQKQVEGLKKLGSLSEDVKEKLKFAEIQIKIEGLHKVDDELNRISKSVNDVMSSINQKSDQIQLESLKKSGNTIKAISIENGARLKAFDLEVDGLRKITSITEDQQKQINKSREMIIKSNSDLIIEQQKKITKEANKNAEDMYKKLIDTKKGLQENIEKEGKSEFEIIEMVKQARLSELKDVENLLIKAKLLNDERKKEIGIVGELINKNADLLKEKQILDQQKISNDLLKENRQILIDIGKDQLSKLELIQLETDLMLDQINVKMLDKKLSQESLRLLQQQKDLIQQKGVKSKSEVGVSDMSMGDVASSAKGAIATVSAMSFSSSGMKEAAKGFVDYSKSGFVSIAQSFSKITVGDIMSGIGSAMQFGADMFMGVLSAKPLDFVATILEAIEQLPESIMGILDRIDVVITKLIDKFPAMFSKLMEKLPVIIDKLVAAFPKIIDMLVEALPKIMSSLMDGIGKMIDSLMDALPKILDALFDAMIQLVDKLPEIIDNILDKLPEVLNKLFDRLPDLVQAIFRAIPKIIVSILDNLPDILESLIGGIIGAIGEIVTAFVDEFLLKGGLERIIVGIIKAIPRIVVALVKGIVNGLTKFFKSVGNLFGGKKIKTPQWVKDLPTDIANGAKKLGNDIANASSNLFKVGNLQDAMKQASLADKVKKEFTIGSNNLVNAMKSAMSKFSEMLKNVWLWIKEKIWQPIVDALYAVWNWVNDTIFKPIITAFTNLWNFVNDTIFKPIIKAFDDMWKFLKNNIFDPIINAFTTVFSTVKAVFDPIINAFKNIGTTIWDGFKNGLSKAGDIFSNIGTSIWEGLKKGLSGLGNFLKGIFDKLNPANLFSKIFKVDMGGKGTIEKTLGIDIPFMKFAKGGHVSGQAKVSGDSEANDNILALLSAGEYVVPRSVMNDPRLSSAIQQIAEKGTIPRFAIGGFAGQIIEEGKGAVDTVVDIVKNPSKLLDKLDPREHWKKIEKFVKNDMIMKMFEANKFATGGLVGGSGYGDNVPSMLSPSEYVVNRDAVKKLGVNTMNSINRGELPASSSSSNVVIEKIEINTTQPIDAGFIKSKLMPKLREEFKRASLDGQFVISAKGVR